MSKLDMAALDNYQVGTLVKGVASVRDGRTTPPDYFTDGELVEVMENVARFVKMDDAMVKVLKDKSDGRASIGTARTRGTFPKGLVKSGLIEAVTGRGKKGRLMPTAEGIRVVHVQREAYAEITDPTMTAKWEIGLKMVANGQLTKARFIGGVETQVRQMVAGIRASAPAGAGEVVDIEPLPGDGGACPECSKGVLVTGLVKKPESKAFGKRFLACSDSRKCGYLVKNSFAV